MTPNADRRFEAAVLDWDGRDAARLRQMLQQLCERGFDVGVVSGVPVDVVDARLLASPDEPDAVSRLLAEFWKRGIGPQSVLIAGDELELLEEQLALREQRHLPQVGAEPGWSLALEGLDAETEPARAVLLTLADGLIGTTGAPVTAHPAAARHVFAAVYDGEGPETSLLDCVAWNLLPGEAEPGSIRRVLDLRAGLVRQDLRLADGSSLAAVLFTSLARPGSAVLRAEGPVQLLAESTPLAATARAKAELVQEGRITLAGMGANHGGVAVAAAEEHLEQGPLGRLDRVAVYRADRSGPPPLDHALPDLVEAERDGFERLLVEHRRAWAERWEDADVVIEGDPELQLAVRFALFHLIASVADSGEAAAGARGLSGTAYRGHVFWDGDVFALPFLAATHPRAARAMLEYRIRRLPVAQATARELDRAGARFPWESATLGNDVTPPFVYDRTGQVIPIRTGTLEEHVTADVAWAAAAYVDWTGDEEFAAGPGRELLVETARYWASRIRLGADGRGHIYGVIGPDEYHEPVDDNAFTNVMARWNLRKAAALDGVDDGERATWLATAESLVDGYDPQTGLYEQFAGFFDLEPLVVENVVSRPMAADRLVGRKRLRGTQIIKQSDVVMLHHLVPEEVAPGSLQPNLLFYESRTTHGSSLSPGIHASLFARAGLLERAVENLHTASRLDLDDLTGTTAQGLHLATLGSVWQALVFGFAGLRPTPDALQIDPRLPPDWEALELRVRFRGSGVRVRIEPEALTVVADPGATVHVAGTPSPVAAGPTGVQFERRSGSWAAV
jgi:hypothetical protein